MVGSGDDAAPTVVLRLPASPAHVRTARLVAAAMARRSGVDEGLLDEVRLAVGEACARAVRQHERYGVQEPVTLEFGDRGSFSVAVIDRAPPTGERQPAAVWAGGAVAEGVADPGVGRLPVASGTTADPIADGDGDPALPWRALDATPDSLGLALLGAVVQDLAVTPAEAGIGTRVAMSWPLEN